MSLELTALFNSNCEFAEGFPYPDWDALDKWAEDNVAESDLETFWRDIASLWVDRIVERLGTTYRRFESDEFILVTAEPNDVAENMLRFCDEKLIQVLKVLKNIALDSGYGKRLVLHFNSSDVYWEYVAEFESEEETSGSAGCFLDRGYGHIAVASEYHWFTETVILHELAHGCLMHLSIPLWLNEGLAKAVELQCKFTAPLLLERETYEKHQELWDEESIQEFWQGHSFSDPEEHSELSYQLAEILMNLIADEVRGQPEEFAAFVNDAKYEDCGEAAAWASFGKGLGEIISRFLGPGNWAPLPFEPEMDSDRRPLL